MVETHLSGGGCSNSDKKGILFGGSFGWVPIGVLPRNLVDMQFVRQCNPPELCFTFGGKEGTFVPLFSLVSDVKILPD